MTTIIETSRLVRIGNCLMAAAGTLVGSYMTWVRPQYYGPVMTAVSVLFVCASGNIMNDVVDLDADRINHPRRPLVRGVLTRWYARWLALTLMILGLVAAVAVNWSVAVLTLAGIGLLVAYNLKLKRLPLVGNLSVAVLGAMTFIAGGLAVDNKLTFTLPGPLIAAVYAFFFHLVRELLKDAQDMEGDRRAGMRTLPQVLGVRRTAALALALFFLLVLLMMVPALVGWFGVWYRTIAIYGVGFPLLVLLIFVWGDPSRPMLRAGTIVLKVGMLLGLVALVAA